jgi:uncharacterized repeat protein (TIGR03843 family)
MTELPVIEIVQALQQGEVALKGEFVWGSNYTFLVNVQQGDQTFMAVYKPTKGERPLWDFPAATLACREAAAFLVSEALEWELVPPTVYRPDGPMGPGSVQLFIDHDPEYHYFNLMEDDRQRLRPTALFDLLINNADRKGSHILFDANRHIWLIDHGICFHEENKLRTVVWDFAGQAIPAELADGLRCFLEKLGPARAKRVLPLRKALSDLLSPDEIGALKTRADWLLARGRFPNPPQDQRPYPWPPI